MEEVQSGGNKCVNVVCGAEVAAGQWKKGWALRSGGFAGLCNSCGMAYEKMVFCDIYHSVETGWRECHSCSKRLHCGCIASKSSMELLDSGGVQCINCLNFERTPNVHSECVQSTMHSALAVPNHQQIPNILEPSPISTEFLQQLVSTSPTKVGMGVSLESNASQMQRDSSDGNMYDETNGKIMHVSRNTEVNGQSSSIDSFGHIKQEPIMLSVGDCGTSGISNINQALQVPSDISRFGEINYNSADNVTYEARPQASLVMSLGTSIQHNPQSMDSFYNSGNSNVAFPSFNTVADGREHNNLLPTFPQIQRSRHLLPKPPKTCHGSSLETSNDMLPHMRVARPPGDGRGRNQLLPRYWPRITDEELQQMTGDSNSTIIPLFEKVLSASDAGRIGRLVLPKACAEAYFPPISHPEGVPLKIQDLKGNNWVFQFRFWPNNNSRMYVLEGVTPWIQSWQLQAGDTVTFSRMEPVGKLIMGFRKATNSVQMQLCFPQSNADLLALQPFEVSSELKQDSHISAIANGTNSNENFILGITENLPIISGYPEPHQSLKVNIASHLSGFSEGDGDKSSYKTNKRASSIEELQKKGGHIGSKSKRLHIGHGDALELKLTWEEAQDLLRPPLSEKPSIVMIEDHEFEEYEEPPVLGKRTIFTARTSGVYDQWAQCDSCFKWRRLPADVLLTSKWTCVENLWDLKRSSCTTPPEMNPEDIQNLLQMNTDLRRRNIGAKLKISPEEDESSSGLDALATIATFGDDITPPPLTAKTTKHPRHRPGCTCIVCIQPPSGKGPKHKPTCMCNVCTSVKRRFNTLMLRKKKRQSGGHEEEQSLKILTWTPSSPDDLSKNVSGGSSLDTHLSKSGSEFPRAIISENLDTSNEHLNLNSHPMQVEGHIVRLKMTDNPHKSDHSQQMKVTEDSSDGQKNPDRSTSPDEGCIGSEKHH